MKKYLSLVLVAVLLLSVNFSTNKVSSENECDWPCYGGSNANTRSITGDCGPSSNELELISKWEPDFIPNIGSGFVFDEGRMFCISENGHLYCFDQYEGKMIWVYKSNSYFNFLPIIINNRLYIGDNTGIFYCISTIDKTIIWKKVINNDISSGALYDDGKIFFTSSLINMIFESHYINCLSAENGDVLWQYNYDTAKWASFITFTIINGKLILIEKQKSLICFNSTTGTQEWKYNDDGELGVSIYTNKDKIIVFSNKYTLVDETTDLRKFESKILCFSSNGIQMWRYDSLFAIKELVINNDKVYCQADFMVYCLDTTNGLKLWKFQVDDNFRLFYAGKYFLLSLSEKFVVISCANGEKVVEYSNEGYKGITNFVFNESSAFFINRHYDFSKEELYEIYILSGVINKIAEASVGYPHGPYIKDNNLYVSLPGSLLSISILSITHDINWRIETQSIYVTLLSLPCSANNKVFISIGRTLYCVSSENGKQLWAYKASNNLSTPTYCNGKVFVEVLGDVNKGGRYLGSKIIALSEEDGKRVWESGDIGFGIISGPSDYEKFITVTQNEIFFRSNNEEWEDLFICYDIRQKKINWQSKWKRMTDWFNSTRMVVYNDKVLYSTEDLSVYCLDIKTGKTIWSNKYPGEYGISNVSVNDGKAYFGVNGKEKLYCVDISDGRTIWSYNVENFNISHYMILTSSYIIFTERDNMICLNPYTGKLMWEKKGLSSEVSKNNILYAVDNDFSYTLDATTGRVLGEKKEIYIGGVIPVGNKFFNYYGVCGYFIGNVAKPSKITLNSESATVDPCSTYQFEAKVYDQNNKEILSPKLTWSVDDENIGKIDQNGLFKPAKVGKVKVFCKCGDLIATSQVNVANSMIIDATSLDFDNVTANVSQTKKITITNVSEKPLSISIESNSKHISINNTKLTLSSNERKGIDVFVLVKDSTISGDINDQIKVNYLSCSITIPCIIKITTVKECIILSDSKIDFGYVGRGQKKTMSVDVKSTELGINYSVYASEPWLNVIDNKFTTNIDVKNISVTILSSSLPSQDALTCNLIFKPNSTDCKELSIPVYIKTEKNIQIDLQVNSKTAYINGIERSLDVPPTVIRSKTMLPLRFTMDSFGCTTFWDGYEKKLTITRYDMNIVMWIGKDIVEVNGLQKKIDAPPVILKESTMVPLRFISDSFGAKTLWDQDTKKITISWPK